MLGELPVHCFARFLASIRPRKRFFFSRGPLRDTSSKALGRECRACNCRHMQPTAFLRRRGPRKPLGALQGFFRWEHLGKRARRMRMQVVLHKANTSHRRIIQADKVLHTLGIITSRASCSPLHIAQTGLRLKSSEDTAHPMPFRFLSIAKRLAWFHGKRHEDISKQLTRPLVITDERGQRIIGTSILSQDICHMPERITRNLAYAPAFVQPGLQLVFFHVFLTLSMQRESTTCSSTRRAAIMCKVQRAVPSGASEQAIIAT
jgi:hypothetical protein